MYLTSGYCPRLCGSCTQTTALPTSVLTTASTQTSGLTFQTTPTPTTTDTPTTPCFTFCLHGGFVQDCKCTCKSFKGFNCQQLESNFDKLYFSIKIGPASYTGTVCQTLACTASPDSGICTFLSCATGNVAFVCPKTCGLC